MSSANNSLGPLFEPIKVGNATLSHRVAMAPMTRHRADAAHVHIDGLGNEYYAQRAGAAGTLIITEATFIAKKAGGYEHIPGIWNQDQIKAWKKVTDAVHDRGSFIYLQLWALGRSARMEVLLKEGLSANDYVSASNVRLDGHAEDPRPLTVLEIKEWVQLYAQAARNAVEAGFDGVEVHAANGYLLDQFLQDITNKRTDDYGGSVENRSRFVLEVVKAVVNAIGEKRTGIRFSPWSKFLDVGMADPIPQFSHVITSIRDTYPDFAYIHLIESTEVAPSETSDKSKNDFARAIWGSRPYIANEGFTRASALRWAKNKGDIVAFGKHFLANPDLVRRLKEDLPLTQFDYTTFFGEWADPKGYTDYKFYEA